MRVVIKDTETGIHLRAMVLACFGAVKLELGTGTSLHTNEKAQQ